ncbi:MAG: Do family serine endopeptidase [Alphaproteobacteria bacterium]|nr:Do family serine endopeptidase [Alphaproteobacteria bacterium]
MHTHVLTGARRWLGASALALIVAVPTVIGVNAISHSALAQTATTTNVAQIKVAPNAPASFADLVEAVKPAVVSISVEGEQSVPNTFRGNGEDFYFNFPDLPEDSPFRRFFDQFEEFGPNGRNNNNDDQQRPQTRRFEAAGSGFIISADGYVVTNNHVVSEGDKITVLMDNGDELRAELIGTDPRTDLALLKIKDASDLPFVTFAKTEARVGDWVVAVGNPFGLGGTVTAGIISARGRDISGSATGDFLQIDAAINRGNSGGPAFNLQGEVVGVNTAIFSPNGGSVGIGFAIPAEIVQQIVEDLKDDGTVTRGFLGVNIQDVTRDIALSVGLPTPRGAVVTEPREGAPAARAGIKSGDIIVEVDGEAIDNALALSRVIAGKAPGSKVSIGLWREGARKDVIVTLDTLDETEVAEAPPAPTPPQDIPAPVESSVGIALLPNADGDGLVIESVNENAIAASKGLIAGDIVLEADYKALASVDDFEKALSGVRDSGRETVLLKTSRDGSIRFVGLPLNEG